MEKGRNKLVARILSLRHEDLIKGSFWLTVGGFIANFGNYLFNLLMGRLLTPIEYGTFMSLLSLSIIISLPSSIITTVVAKFSADFYAKEEISKISRMIRKFTELTLLGALGIIIVFFVFNELLQQFLNIDSQELIMLTGIMIGVGLITSINQGVYRGLLLFKALSILGILTVIIKLIFGWTLVVELAVYGALIAVFISSIIPWIISFFPIRNYFRFTTAGSSGIKKRIVAFSLPVFLVTAATTFYVNADLLLVKHYLSEEDAGIYAAVGVMGKAIFYVLGPISIVLFSLISQKFAVKKNIRRELVLSLLFTVIGGICALLIYLLFPDFIVNIFFPNNQYSQTSQYIFYYGVYMVLFSVVFLLVNYFLAIEKSVVSYLAFFSSVIQIVLISLFHSSIMSVISVSILSIGTLCFLLLLLLIPLMRTSNGKT